MQDRRRWRVPPDQSPDAAEDEPVRCRVPPCVPERFRWNSISGFAVCKRPAGTETGPEREPQSQPSRVWNERISPHDPEGARPARLVKEVIDDLRQESQAVVPVALFVLVRRSEAPVTAVVAHVAVVAHGKVAVWRHDDIATLYMRRQFLRPFLISYLS